MSHTALRYLWVSCIVMVYGLGALTAYAQSLPSQPISLADWGVTSRAQIGFVSLGIVHKQRGDEMVIYDIRTKRPVVREPKGTQGRIPSFEGDVFVVGNFNRGNVNRLGGYFNGFAKRPSQSSVVIEQAPDGAPALTFSYINKQPGFAGFWTHLFDFKAPPAKQIFLDISPFAYLTFAIRGEKGDEDLALQVADRIWEKKEDSLWIGDVASFLPSGKIDTSWQRAWIPLSPLTTRLDQKQLASIVFQVQGERSGRVFIRDLAFTRKKDIPIPMAQDDNVTYSSLDKAMWLWETETILTSQQELQTLLAFCTNQGITDLFVQIPYTARKENGGWKISWNSSTMRHLIAELHQAGIKVHALDGDPRFALRQWHGRVIALIQEIIRHNQSVPAPERFDGIRYDNEPYLLPNFGGIQKQQVLKEYLELLETSQLLAHEAGLTFGVDIPFWFDSLNEFFEPTAAVDGRPMSERILDVVDNVGIMDYRTIAYGADGVIAHATDELRYAARLGKKVFVGLETVTLPDETIYEFGTNGGGSALLITQVDERRVELTWVPEGTEVPADGALLLRETRAIAVPSSKITFDRKTLQDLREVTRHTEGELRQFSSFQGFAIHSYESYRPWLIKRTQ
ncbi:MAG: hypothetical protein OEQ39_05305 [Gammaproteobacteria bacterium]|nr:hypothetical protein [Gammaproteobacteria bacterium]MDH3464846.1 hypothetical protein [Gammaproteobacteria bacterium]